MLVETEPLLCLLRDWIEAVDAHAPHRVPLLQRAEQVLSGDLDASPDARGRLAERLERWRYQHLDSCRDQPSPLHCRLADVLDLLANHLLGRPPRGPRCPRGALADTFRQPLELARAKQCLDRAVPVEAVISRANKLTREHFGVFDEQARTLRRRMLLYAPLYLSNHCVNYCSYCGFRYPNDVARRHLTLDEAIEQADILAQRGFRHVLLVAGDFPRLTSARYFGEIIRALSERGLRVAVEVAPQTTAAYEALAAAGACGVTLYQETYDEPLYSWYHPKGTKSSYDWRLEAMERAAEAGFQRLGLGVLLGLGKPQDELEALVRHARYLLARFPDLRLAFSLPRIHSAPAGFTPPYPADDETLIRMYCALRAAFPAAELVLSTREPPRLRNRLVEICVTQFSAGSSTVPGGYHENGQTSDCGGQFPVMDHRTPADVAAWLEAAGFRVEWNL